MVAHILIIAQWLKVSVYIADGRHFQVHTSRLYVIRYFISLYIITYFFFLCNLIIAMPVLSLIFSEVMSPSSLATPLPQHVISDWKL